MKHVCTDSKGKECECERRSKESGSKGVGKGWMDEWNELGGGREGGREEMKGRKFERLKRGIMITMWMAQHS